MDNNKNEDKLKTLIENNCDKIFTSKNKSIESSIEEVFKDAAPLTEN